MKTLKYIALSLLACGAFCACDDEVEYTPGNPQNTGENVYFPEGNDSPVVLQLTQESFTIDVARESADSAASVPIICTSLYADLFTVPATVEFAVGETEAEIEIKVDPTKLEPFKSYPMNLAVEEEYTHQYADNVLSPSFYFTIQQEDYKTVYSGIYKSLFWFEDEWEDVIQYSELLGTYRIANFWYPGYHLVFTWDGGEEVVVNGNASFASGYEHPDYGMVSIVPLTDGDASLSYYDADEKTFYFAFDFQVSAGSFGQGYEAFAITE